MPIVAELRIAVDDKGAVSVTGPIDQLLFCYGLLELAKDTIRRAAEEKRHAAIQQPAPSDLALFGGKRS